MTQFALAHPILFTIIAVYSVTMISVAFSETSTNTKRKGGE